jgi:SAM-dependent methyltransferase
MSTDANDPRRHAPATLRNREAVLDVLRRVLPPEGLLLEIASGTGEHAAFMAPALSEELRWQPSDAEPLALASIDAHARASGSSRIEPALLLDAAAAVWPVQHADAVFAANLVHIAPFRVAEGLLNGAGRVLAPGGPLVLYGPFKRHGAHTAISNDAFDRQLRAQDPAWGVRCLDTELAPVAAAAGLVLDDVLAMPANNLTVIWRRQW